MGVVLVAVFCDVFCFRGHVIYRILLLFLQQDGFAAISFVLRAHNVEKDFPNV